MKRVQKILLAIIIVLGVQLVGSLLLVYPYIIHWGATSFEGTMPMTGDKYAEEICATRAIDIHRPQADVWAYTIPIKIKPLHQSVHRQKQAIHAILICGIDRLYLFSY